MSDRWNYKVPLLLLCWPYQRLTSARVLHFRFRLHHSLHPLQHAQCTCMWIIHVNQMTSESSDFKWRTNSTREWTQPGDEINPQEKIKFFVLKFYQHLLYMPREMRLKNALVFQKINWYHLLYRYLNLVQFVLTWVEFMSIPNCKFIVSSFSFAEHSVGSV